MIPLSDCHVHTTFCDGADTVETLCETALQRNFVTLGISGHGYTAFDTSYCMKNEALSLYAQKITSLKETCHGKGLSLFLGIEKDLYGEGLPGSDYTIHSVHYVKKNDVYHPVDESPAHLQAAIDAFGDPYTLCEVYFSAVEEAALGTGEILGHLDLIAKFNEGGRFFDETHPRYRRAALKAVEAAKKGGKIVEVNLGAYRKGLRSVPYPAPFIMESLFSAGVPVMINGDTHKAADLGNCLQEAVDYVRSFGFSTVKTLTQSGFADTEL